MLMNILRQAVLLTAVLEDSRISITAMHVSQLIQPRWKTFAASKRSGTVASFHCNIVSSPGCLCMSLGKKFCVVCNYCIENTDRKTASTAVNKTD